MPILYCSYLKIPKAEKADVDTTVNCHCAADPLKQIYQLKNKSKRRRTFTRASIFIRPQTRELQKHVKMNGGIQIHQNGLDSRETSINVHKPIINRPLTPIY